ncbi:transporter family-2 protein [Paenibacillaceae bacterium GAS479]|nr:transporter family-2 protein [Paenibacillaceae bacterium GAS479]
MAGMLWALAAGLLLSLQNLFNYKVDEKAGMWTTTTLILGMGFLASFMLGLGFEGSGLWQLQGMEVWHGFSGLIGIGVVTCLVQGVKRLGATYAISIVLCSQLAFAMIWDTFGWFGLEAVPLDPTKLAGVLVLAAGILVFKLGKGKKVEAPSSIAASSSEF